jgi:hypothetical protein
MKEPVSASIFTLVLGYLYRGNSALEELLKGSSPTPTSSASSSASKAGKDEEGGEESRNGFEVVDDLLGLIDVSEYFMIDSLVLSSVEELLLPRINPHSVCSLWNLAAAFPPSRLGQLEQYCHEYFVQHFLACSMTKGFLLLDKELLKKVSNVYKMRNGDHKCSFVYVCLGNAQRCITLYIIGRNSTRQFFSNSLRL